MKNSEVYRKAAKRIVEGKRFSSADVCVCMCDAIFHAVGGDLDVHHALANPLKNYFLIDAVAAGPDHYRWGKNFGTTKKQVKDCRVLALCFMAAISESEGN